MRWIAGLLFTLVALPATAYELSGNATQGGMMIGRDATGQSVTVDNTSIRVSPEGYFVFGFGRDHKSAVTLTVGNRTEIIDVAPRVYPTQKINGLPSKYVSPPPETLARIRRENGAIGKARAHDTPATWFAQDWIWPSIGPISKPTESTPSTSWSSTSTRSEMSRASR